MTTNISQRTRRVTVIALLSCLSFVGRMMFSFLPNVQPTTVIIILITIYMGFYEGIMVATISMLMSNIYLGMGIWTIAQIVSYFVIVSFVYVLAKTFPKSVKYFSYIAFTTGLLYGLVISLVQAPFFGWTSFIPYYFSGISYDFSHAVGNYLFFIILEPSLKNILKENKFNQI